MWDNLFGQAAPSIPPLLELEEPTRDGTTLNFSLYDVEDEFEGLSISSAAILMQIAKITPAKEKHHQAKNGK